MELTWLTVAVEMILPTWCLIERSTQPSVHCDLSQFRDVFFADLNNVLSVPPFDVLQCCKPAVGPGSNKKNKVKENTQLLSVKNSPEINYERRGQEN